MVGIEGECYYRIGEQKSIGMATILSVEGVKLVAEGKDRFGS